MNTITVYELDAHGIMLRAVELDPYGPMPPRSTITPPPPTSGTEVARYADDVWAVLPELPAQPEAEPEQPAVPAEVTMRQARLALLGAGKLGQIDAAIDALPSPQREEARIEWDYSSTVVRNRNLVAMIGAALGMDDQALDQMFITAAGL